MFLDLCVFFYVMLLENDFRKYLLKILDNFMIFYFVKVYNLVVFCIFLFILNVNLVNYDFLKYINWDYKVLNSLNFVCKYFIFFLKIKFKLNDIVENKYFVK